MKRPHLAVVAAVAAALLLSTTTAAVVTFAAREDVPGGPAMMGPGSGGQPGPRADRGPGGWMNGRGGFMMGGPGGSRGVARSELEFLTRMVAHHQEAVDAAGELARSDRAEMRAFGRDIVATQTAQIEQMRAWLADWYPGRSTGSDYQPMMRDLSDLSGDRLDQVFLQDMIGHHMGAVMMSQHLLVLRTAEHRAVSRLARTIRDEQHAEILWMQGRLADWFDLGWHQGWGGRGLPMSGEERLGVNDGT